eukprot:288010-Prymnesium_polylepis.1
MGRRAAAGGARAGGRRGGAGGVRVRAGTRGPAARGVKREASAASRHLSERGVKLPISVALFRTVNG